MGEDWEARNVPRKNTDKGSRPVKNPHKHVGKKDLFGFCFDGLAFGLDGVDAQSVHFRGGGGGASHENKPRTENPTFVPIVVPSPSYKTLPRSHGVVGDLDIFGAV